MSNFDLPTKPCHTCRRRRLKCDRSYPQCHKCIQMGQECLGYQGLFLWNKGVASRGKMMGLTWEEVKHSENRHEQPRTETSISTYNGKAVNMALSLPSTGLQALQPADNAPPLLRAPQHRIPQGELTGMTLSRSLTDSLFQDLDQSSRNYLCYFSSHVCKDLVIYDVPCCNPFRDLIPLTREYPVLFQIVLANSALHISNALQRSVLRKSPSGPLLRATTSHGRKCMSLLPKSLSSEYRDAFISKQSALRLLRQALEDMQSVNLDIILASVLLFIEFELIDSGKDDWRLHMNGARRLIKSLLSSSDPGLYDISAMRSCWVSNCLVYDILGSTLASTISSETPRTSYVQLVSTLEYAESNNYLSCPAMLLQHVLAATEVLRIVSSIPVTESTSKCPPAAQQLLVLLQAVRSFDALAWATSLQRVSPHKDVDKRIHIASAHKAAVCIYISRALLSLSQDPRVSDDLETLVSDAMHHLSFLTCNDELFKATSWPTFIAGAETRDLIRQEWAAARLYKLWDLLPWGYIRTALEILDTIWEKRNTTTNSTNARMNWVQELRSRGVDWLIA